MTRMRGADPFPRLWKRRTTVALPDGTECDLLSLPDLVQAKRETQGDKDWPMLRRLPDDSAMREIFATLPPPTRQG